MHIHPNAFYKRLPLMPMLAAQRVHCERSAFGRLMELAQRVPHRRDRRTLLRHAVRAIAAASAAAAVAAAAAAAAQPLPS